MAGNQKVTQCEEILRYMADEGSITQLDTLREFGCMRLASRITDLKKAGFVIHKEMEKAKSKRGKTVRYARYRLEN